MKYELSKKDNYAPRGYDYNEQGDLIPLGSNCNPNDLFAPYGYYYDSNGNIQSRGEWKQQKLF